MLKKITLYTFALLGMLIILNSCKKEYESIESIDDAKIQAYIKQNNLTMTKDPAGFYYQLVTSGTGAPLKNIDSVFYEMTVKSLSGTSYYATRAYSNEGDYVPYAGYSFANSYRLALAGVNRGSKVRVILPSYLAYGKNGTTGTNGTSSIPSNEIIISELTTYNETAQWQLDDKNILKFLADNKITATKNPNRVYVNTTTRGTGTTVDLGSSVTVKYKGRLLDGTVFDQTTDDATFIFTVGAGTVIKGWDAFIGMPKGTKARMFIPSDLAYGPAGQSAIPPNAILDFDVEVVDVQ